MSDHSVYYCRGIFSGAMVVRFRGEEITVKARGLEMGFLGELPENYIVRC